MTDGLSAKLADVERTHILAVLVASGGSRTLAAARLGISTRCLQYKLARYQREGIVVMRAAGRRTKTG